ncbi:transporter substrate-binding domain-containing protein [Maritalea porphyrae]|jgi:polar amino acid transport system substrate-binding protein|uniref:transporter substrate-binding domain-containing protein n=1 Tax=Maritalea porphyrae TaxID=880732 RepID=UPI0022AF27C8|nr:transporter substrate-binding domain-containing protein [Maritalea porphyrae]MCZ4271268.1 transporter substrate-binding domain-containing protein [Maritalea porphyrae]
MKLKEALLGTAAAVMVLGASASAFAGEVLDKIMADKMLIVGTNSDYRPNSFLGDDNQLQGFDISVAKEVAKRMSVEVKFITPGWEVMTAGNWSGRWHMVIGSMTPTKSRAEILDFPAIYYFSPAVVAVHKNSSATKPSDLDGKVMGVVGSSTYHAYLEHRLEMDVVGAPEFTYDISPSEVKLYSDINEFDDLSVGDGVRMDGLIQSLSVVAQAVERGMPVKQIGDPVFYEPLGIATDKGDAELNAKIAEVVEQMRDDGTLAALSVKWHGVDLVTVK